MKRIIRTLFLILVLSLPVYLFIARAEKVKVTRIEGTLVFTDEYKPEATICIPAAYTDGDGKIVGQYRIKNKSYGSKYFKERVSLHPSKGLVISSEWTSANGFQQHVLVKNGKVKSFKDKRKFRRRALCSDDSKPGSYVIIESTRRMTMNEFSAEVAKHSNNAVNLDMGRWGYGWIGKKKLSRWTRVYKNWQTNWIVCS